MSIEATAWAWKQEIKPTAKLVLMALADISNVQNGNRCWPSITHVAKRTGYNRATVIRALAELQNLNLITKVGSHGLNNEYRCNLKVELVAESNQSQRATSRREQPNQSQKVTSRTKQPVAQSDVGSRRERPKLVAQSDTKPEYEPAINLHTASGDAAHDFPDASLPDPSPPLPAPGGESITTRRKRKLKGKKLEWFLSFWDCFDYKMGRAEAADAWLDIENLTAELVEKINTAARLEARDRPGALKLGRIPKMAQGWLSGRRWEDERASPGGSISAPGPSRAPPPSVEEAYNMAAKGNSRLHPLVSRVAHLVGSVDLQISPRDEMFERFAQAYAAELEKLSNKTNRRATT